MAHESKGNGTSILTIIAVAIAAFAGGYFVKQGTTNTPTDAGSAIAAKEVKGTAGDSTKIPLGKSFVMGNPNAPITIVEFSDFQCPFCSRGGSTAKKALEKYPNDVKIVFKHFPLAFHKEAPAASHAAIAAGNQGKFSEMHDLLFGAQKSFKGKGDKGMKDLAVGFANKLGLDVKKFEKDMASPATAKIVKDDMAVGGKLGVRGTPHFFINGERLSGAQPFPKFEEIIKKQIGEVKTMLAAGTAKSEIYGKMVSKNYKAAAKKPNAKPAGQVVNFVPVDAKDPVKGAKNPLVTIVEFSDFQCPFCTRVNPTIAKIMENYSDKVRVVFKQAPLPFHKQAPAAAAAALAANQQGKFWEMHDMLFANQKQFKTTDMTELTTGFAQKLGLNTGKFKAALTSDAVLNKVKADGALAKKVGARGTPNFFVNGVQLVGAKPYPAFEAEIKKQIKIAEKLKKDNLSGDALYKAAVAYNKKNAPKAAPKAAAPPSKVDLSKLKIGNSHVKGNKNAKVKIFEFSDFQCPYCSRGNTTVQKVKETYGDKVAVIFKAFPLPFHKQAPAAHHAALAAGKQGKFWEMHDLLFAASKTFKTADMNELTAGFAAKIGINVEKFKKDMMSDEIAALAQKETAEGKVVGVRGTPAFFVNGNRLVGAQPFEKFKELVDAELKK